MRHCGAVPGVGAFTIVDAHKVSAEDVGCNFFVTLDAVGRSRAEVACTLLQELNETDVRGRHLELVRCP